MVLFESDTPKILLVDDKAENLVVLIEMLKPLELELFVALSADEAYSQVEKYDFNLILLDIVMPDIDGYEVCSKFKNSPKYKDIPLIFITALSGIEDKIKGFSYGIDDYMIKPLVQKELLARVKLHLQKGMLLKSLKQLLRKSYHELYNPLAIINTSLEMQNIKYGNTQYTDSITVASRTLQIVYDDLYYSLSSKTEHTSPLFINLKEFVQKRINYFYYLAKTKNITIDLNAIVESNIVMHEADLQRVVDNTLSNAIKYADNNSLINIDISSGRNTVIFTSKNIGTIIENPHKIFKKGYREDYEQIGMGIGLEIVASICRTNNIKTEVVSKNSETMFKYHIPIVFN